MKKQTISDGIIRFQFDTEDEWREHRKRIGGSDAAGIIGKNPYKTNQELFREKTGRIEPEDISDKPYVIYGHQAEPHLRALFALDFPEYQVNYYENNLITNAKYPWAHASLDGELVDPDGRRGVLEIKTSNILQSMQRESWKDQIPDNYYCQVLWYLMVTEYDFAVLVAQLKTDFHGEIRKQVRHYFIERSEVEDDIEYLADAGREFWEAVTKDREPGLILPGF